MSKRECQRECYQHFSKRKWVEANLWCGLKLKRVEKRLQIYIYMDLHSFGSLSLAMREETCVKIRVQVFHTQPSSFPWPNNARFHPCSAIVAFLDLTTSSHFCSMSSCYRFFSTLSHCRHSSLRLCGASLIVVSLKSWALALSFTFSSVH